MKNLFVLSVAILAMSGCDTKSSSEINFPESAVISLVPDVTDKRLYLPPADDILRLYGCEKTPDASYLFRLRPITDRRLTPIETVLLPDAVTMAIENRADDPQFRNKSIVSFYTAVRDRIGTFYSQADTTASLGASECFRAIAGELSFLAGSNKKRCVLLIASDLMEKSNLWDFYLTLPASPKEFAKKLESTGLLPASMQNIEVIFLFNPKDRTEDQNFSLLAEGYKLALEAKGAKVNIQASL